MRRRFLTVAAAGLLAGCAADTPPPEPDYRVVGSVRQVMDALTIPASDAVWAAAGEPPATDAAWAEVENAAIALAESGNLLLMPGRGPDEDAWKAESVRLIDAATVALEAARRRDLDAIMDAGDVILDSCSSCHRAYMDPGM